MQQQAASLLQIVCISTAYHIEILSMCMPDNCWICCSSARACDPHKALRPTAHTGRDTGYVRNNARNEVA
jgi:hypothetical protein